MHNCKLFVKEYIILLNSAYICISIQDGNMNNE